MGILYIIWLREPSACLRWAVLGALNSCSSRGINMLLGVSGIPSTLCSMARGFSSQICKGQAR